MDIFVRNVPQQASKKQLETYFRTPLAECGIQDFHADKMRDKPLAVLTVLDTEKCQRFLALYGVPPNAPPSVRATKPLSWGGKFLQCSKSRNDPSDLSVRSLAYEATQRAAKATSAVPSTKTQNAKITRFAIQGLQCGVWDYSGTQLAFVQHFRDGRPGTVHFGLKEVVTFMGASGSNQSRIDLSYFDCINVILGTYHDPTITFTLRILPKFYEVSGEDVLAAALFSMTLGPRAPKLKAVKKTRLTSINDMHAKVAGLCFVYRITLADYRMLSTVRTLLSRNAKMPATMSMSTPTVFPLQSLVDSFTLLNYDLTDTERYGKLPFSVLYQLDRLARNSILSPLKVRELLPKVFKLHQDYGLDATLSALRRFCRQAPQAGPDTDHSEFSRLVLEHMLEQFAANYDAYQHNPENPYQLVKRHTHINLIHKVVVTPAAIYLEGPEPEPTNRVLRRYEAHSDNFVRVIFQDEDGGSVRYDPRASQEVIFHKRFKSVLDKNILIAGHGFSFLGFSHSSLRSQSCWFMAPMYYGHTLRLTEHVLKELGDFSNIRIPAKCAARIGQNFTDTNATIDLHPSMVSDLPMVQRNGRDFSDGVGTISEGLLRRVWRVYGTRRLLKPTVLQIRFQGAKGMVSLDPTLQGEQLKLRANMRKFETSSSWNLEICGAGFRPLPMILNRQFIKILEDLRIAPGVFMDLQRIAVDKLRFMTASAINTSSFLEEVECPRATQMPSLVRQLGQIGLDYHQDSFLYSVVEIAVVTKLRDIKYRGRIPVDSGCTLYGIMDESGYLREGEIYVVTEKSPEGGRQVLVMDPVVITRSPAMHPGDVQIVNAVDVPPDNPLRRLSNVVVFSQHGARDLPSQLSGGDLDGDIFNVIWDRQLVPAVSHAAADYPRVSAVELDRPVTSKDMSDFLVTFMESDQLGMLCNIHMQLADQRQAGTFDEACIKLASMASTAVDFSKTGIPIDMKECPRYDRCRPDFMAPSPRVIVSDQGYLDVEETDNDEDDAFEGLDAERRSFRYYESRKVLGQLYRAIEERRFLAQMQQDHRARTEDLIDLGTPTGMLDTLLAYMKRQAFQYGILFDHNLGLAADIRASYEDSLVDILYHYAPVAHLPISEHEVFAGTILGRQGGAQGKPLRELSKTMRERFEAVVEYTIMRIVKGDEQMQGVNDLDLLYDGSLDREVEALPRAIACLACAVEQPGMVDRQLGPLHSFRYVAAGVCLKELERYRITTLRSYVLPPV